MSNPDDRSDAELKSLAVEIVDGEVFTSFSLPAEEWDHLMPMVFLPLALMNRNEMVAFLEKKPHMLYEHLSKALPRSINGYPIFGSFRILNESESDKVLEFVKQYHALKSCFLEEPPTGSQH